MISEPDTATFTWTPRAAELADAQLARSRDVGGAGMRAAFAVVLALLATSLFLYRQTAVLGAFLIGTALLLVFYRATTPLMRRRWAALLEANPALADTVEATFDESGVHLSGNRVRHSRTWAAFSAWSDTPDAVVLSTSANALGNLLVVPHRAADDDERVAQLRRIVAAELGPAQGDVPGTARRALVTWVARVLVIGCAVVPLGLGMARTHAEGGEWTPWPSEAPPRLSRDGVEYVRDGGPTSQPAMVTGSDYTPGGGLVLVRWPPTDEFPTELWVLDHEGTYRHYLARGGDAAS